MPSVALFAGSVSTVLFAVSTLPMLIKAVRTKELNSYSRGNLVLANVGNAVHSIYVLQLPPGPIWALHSFYVIASGLMLFWHLRYADRRPRWQPANRGQQAVPKDRRIRLAPISYRDRPAARVVGGETTDQLRTTPAELSAAQRSTMNTSDK